MLQVKEIDNDGDIIAYTITQTVGGPDEVSHFSCLLFKQEGKKRLDMSVLGCPGYVHYLNEEELIELYNAIGSFLND